MSEQLTDFELGWLVAILEGEGTFYYEAYTQHLKIRMMDEDTMYKVANLFGRLTQKEFELKTRAPEKTGRHETYEVKLTGENARIVMRIIVPYMSHRRRQRIWQSLNKHVPKKVKIDLAALGLIPKLDRIEA